MKPTLNEGDVVIMDNLSSHKVKGLEEIAKARGARIEYLPPYKPALNPVEKYVVKTFVRYKDTLMML